MRRFAWPALVGVGLGGLLWIACAPQDIYLFDPVAVAVADAGSPPPTRPLVPSVVGPAADASGPVQPRCESSACETCVRGDLCRAVTSGLLCHPRSGECGFWCDPIAELGADGACVGDQRCDAALGMCVDCLTGAHCTSELPACDEPNGVCVECVARDDCPAARPACDTATHRCVQCTASSDCAALGRVCQIESNACVVCLDDGDCAGGEDSRCLPGELRCVECLSATDCLDPERPLCSAEFECEDD